MTIPVHPVENEKNDTPSTYVEFSDDNGQLQEYVVGADKELKLKEIAEKKLEEMEKIEKEIAEEESIKKSPLKAILKLVLKVIGLLGALYFFICSLEIMSLSFRLIGGRYASEAFTSNVILTNPLAGLMIGIVVTVIVQSSSTSTSIVVTMVAAEILKVRQAIPIIMGANIGTSVTSTLVALGQMTNPKEFRRAFSGGIVHDLFNFLCVAILLPLEIASGYLEVLTQAIVDSAMKGNFTSVKEPEFLNAITKPLTSKIIQLDKAVLELIAKKNATGNETLIKHFCGGTKRCDFLLEPLNWPEWTIGLMLLIISLVFLCGCLILMVKVLSSLFKGQLAGILKKTVNSDFPGPFKYLTGYVAILLGCVLTILVQSSSVFTSSLIPLISIGVFELERVFPLVLGSNIGTTVTGILAALSASGSTIKLSLQIALCHTFFNITGILIWYPLPFMRNIPIKCAKYMGGITAKYRWFPIFYLIIVFLFIPLTIFALSLAGWIVLGCVLGPILLLLILILIINVIQNKKPSLLPAKLRTWEFLPIYLRSLEPFDKFLMEYVLCCKRLISRRNRSSD